MWNSRSSETSASGVENVQRYVCFYPGCHGWSWPSLPPSAPPSVLIQFLGVCNLIFSTTSLLYCSSDTFPGMMITWRGQLFSSRYPQRDNFPTMPSPTHYQMLWSRDLVSCSLLAIHRGIIFPPPLRHIIRCYDHVTWSAVLLLPSTEEGSFFVSPLRHLSSILIMCRG